MFKAVPTHHHTPTLYDVIINKPDIMLGDDDFLPYFCDFLSSLSDNRIDDYLATEGFDLDSLLSFLYELDNEAVEDFLICHNPVHYQVLEHYYFL